MMRLCLERPVKVEIDVITDLSFGDTGKGKVTHSLLQSNKYDLVVRTSGSNNAGHTIYHSGHKFVTHLVPAGIFYGVTSIIGKNCLIHPESFLAELDELQQKFSSIQSLSELDVRSLVKIDRDAFVITKAHVEEDSKDSVIGTTKKGTGPAARDKYARTGKQAKDIPELKDYLCDLHGETFEKNVKILCEGAQGFYLDVHFGEYPYVTSSHCTMAAVMLCGLPHTKIGSVYGTIKAYETYVGLNKFEGDDPVFARMREIGGEYGSTTGRARQCNFLNIDKLKKAAHVNGINVLIVNKMDVLQQLDVWKTRFDDGRVCDLQTEESFKDCVIGAVSYDSSAIWSVQFSYQPDQI